MYIAELSDSNLPQRVYKLAEQLLDGFASQKQLELTSSENLFANADPGTCYRINSGGVEVELDNKLLYFLEPGDFIAPVEVQDADAGMIFKCSQPVSLQTYAWEDIAAMLQRDAKRMNIWIQFQAASNTIVLHALARYHEPVDAPGGSRLEFAPGDVIIKQGEASKHVYKLLQGHAEASQQGAKIGDIKAGEIFGSLAVFTGQRRAATVTAKQACTVQAVAEDDFIDMLRVQPETCRTLFETMAGRIVDLNEAILALEPEEAST